MRAIKDTKDVLQFISAHGALTTDQAQQNQQLFEGGMLGISLTSHSFSKTLVQEVALLGSRLCRSFCVIIFDYPERHNWPLKADVVSPRDYQARCLKIGQERQQGIVRTLRQVGLADKVKVATWQLCRQDARFRQNVRLLTKLYNAKGQFYQQLVRQVAVNLGGKIQEVETARARPLLAPETASLHRYLLEEIAGLLFLQFDLGHVLDIYPGPQMAIMHQIYAGMFAEINALGHDWTRQAWLTARLA